MKTAGRRRFGDFFLGARRSRESSRGEGLVQDAAYAMRTMRRNPGFTATAILCLALGIGANTAIFTVIRKVLLEPLPYPHAERIVTVGRPGYNSTESPQRYAYWTRADHGLELLTAYLPGAANLEGGYAPELVKTIAASQHYFQLFGANPILGRTFRPEEDRPGGRRVAVLSYGLWQRRFGGDRAVVGKVVTLGDEPHDVIGVLGPGFTSYPPADVWTPLQADPASATQASTLTVVARLPPGTSLAAADARVNAIATRFAREHSSSPAARPDAQVAPLREQVSGEVRPLLVMLLGAVGLVLLVACANVANLLLARAANREQEFAIRAAIGAGRGRMVRQLLTESMALALGGAAVGLLAGRLGVRALLAMTPGDMPRADEIAASATLDPWVGGFAAALGVGTGLLFGIFPALRISRAAPIGPLKEGAGSGRRKSRALRALAAAEIAMALVLLSGALLMIRSFAAMRALSLGFDSGGLLTMEVSLTGSRYERSMEVDRFARQLAARVAEIPGVESAAVASALPLYGRTDMIFDIPGRSRAGERRFTGDVQWRFITSDYFRLLRIPILAGRKLEEREPGRTVVISEAMARQFWPGANPVGETILIGAGLDPGFEAGPAEIVGVAGDVRERLDHARGAPVMYQLASQIPDRAIALMNRLGSAAILARARPGVSPASLSQPVQQALRTSGRLPATNVRTMEQAAWESTPRHNFNLFLFGAFAFVATLLAAVGIYGVTAYGVEQRRREIGIRTALGATRGDVFRWALREALAISAAGIGLGFAASLALTRLIEALLFGVEPSDAIALVAAPLIAAAVALAAAAIPALRAGRVDPVAALRAG
ncbi:MAG: ABC transporter permease [Bryobacteraceae bacterium]|nr:ABC transporter permease [Bryobacteraceae bacterium]